MSGGDRRPQTCRESRYVLDTWVHRTREGQVLLGGAPARYVQLTDAGSRVLDAALRGGAVVEAAAAGLVERLVEDGLIHPVGVIDEHERERIEVIVPVRDGARWITEVVGGLGRLGTVLVVDDGSRDDSARLAEQAGAVVLRNTRTPGPAGARNTGLRAASTDLVALVDVDCVVARDWLDHLACLFVDPALALAAPRVTSIPGYSAIAAYERVCSPLDLGPNSGLVGPGRRLPYVPAAALLARREALLAVEGFSEELLVGEDVDLVLRLVKRGWRVRYVPQSAVSHYPRTSAMALMRQRAQYGKSAVVLDRHHPGAVSPLRVTPGTASIWASWLAAGPFGAAVAFAASLARAPVPLTTRQERRVITRLVMRGHIHASRHLARVIVREWLPVTVLTACRSRGARRLGLAAYAIDVLASYDRRRSPHPIAHASIRLLDSVGYAAGLWAAAVRTRAPGALLMRQIRSTGARTRREEP